MKPAITIPKLTVFVVCVISVFSSCFDPSLLQQPVTIPESRQKQNYFYTPTSYNTPLLTEKNDLSGSIQHALGSRHTGIEILAAYLPAKHFGMAASYSSGGHDGEIFKYPRISAGAGYVRRF